MGMCGTIRCMAPTYLQLHGGDFRKAMQAFRNAPPSIPDLDTYIVAAKCPVCSAGPGEPCVFKRKQALRYHLARQDRAYFHQLRDIETAPWPEDREPGQTYGTPRP